LGLNALSSLRMVPSHRFEISRLYFPPPGAIQNPREENGDRIKWPVSLARLFFSTFIADHLSTCTTLSIYYSIPPSCNSKSPFTYIRDCPNSSLTSFTLWNPFYFFPPFFSFVRLLSSV
jgi:hypothetical protein